MKDETQETSQENFPGIFIETELKKYYMAYAMSVIVGRTLPGVRDGLKLAHRRALFAMRELSNYHTRPHLKPARIVGDVIGKYHPHGDTAVYDTIVRMAQDFSLRYPFVDGQGNFGSVDGDSPAAMRYTEVRMMRLSHHMLADLDKETVDLTPNYDESLSEPSVLSAKLPALLANGSSCIAVVMTTNITPHNLSEIIEDINAKQVIHMELAYKFYLFDPNISSESINNWIGPNRNDSLNEKLEKLKRTGEKK